MALSLHFDSGYCFCFARVFLAAVLREIRLSGERVHLEAYLWLCGPPQARSQSKKCFPCDWFMSGELYSRYSTCLEVMSETLSLENARERKHLAIFLRDLGVRIQSFGISYYLVQKSL